MYIYIYPGGWITLTRHLIGDSFEDVLKQVWKNGIPHLTGEKFRSPSRLSNQTRWGFENMTNIWRRYPPHSPANGARFCRVKTCCFCKALENISPPETLTAKAPEDGCLEYDRFRWGWPIFGYKLLISGSLLCLACWEVLDGWSMPEQTCPRQKTVLLCNSYVYNMYIYILICILRSLNIIDGIESYIHLMSYDFLCRMVWSCIMGCSF